MSENTSTHLSPNQPRSAGHSSGDKTRTRLINEGLRLFSEQGIGAVSIRTIVAAAGAQNLSAVHYHFGNKEGLVTAIVNTITEQLLPVQTASLEELSAAENPSVREIFVRAFTPYLDMAIASDQGLQQARFLSRLTWEEGEGGQKVLLQQLMGPVLLTIDPLLARALPKKPRAELQLQLMMALTNLIHGTADRSILKHIPLDEVRVEYAANPEPTRARFFDFIAAGLSATSND